MFSETTTCREPLRDFLSAGFEKEAADIVGNAKTKRAGGRRRRRGRCRDNRDDEFFESGHGAAHEEANDRLEAIDESLLSPDERAYRAARRRAEKKVALTRSAVRAALITIPLLIFVPFAGFFAFLYFAIQLGRRAFRLFYEPQLRERFFQEEVQREVHRNVSSERRNLEGEHHRSLEKLSASIAHEIRNPITAAKSLIQQIGEDPQGAEQVEYARVAVAELERVERSISHLLRFAREEDRHVEAISLDDVLESAIETFRDRCVRSEIEIKRQFDAEGRMHGDAEQLRRVVINLVSNAIDALEAARVTKPEVRVSMGENLAGSEVWLRIADNGLGMDEDTQARIFDPFFTSREDGTGLGLALCRKIVDEHEGRIEVQSVLGEGTEFVLSFPKESRA